MKFEFTYNKFNNIHYYNNFNGIIGGAIVESIDL